MLIFSWILLQGVRAMGVPTNTVSDPSPQRGEVGRGGQSGRCSPHWPRHPGLPPSSPPPIVSGSIFAWRWRFQMQAVNMSDQCSFRGPSTEVETQHLIGPLGRCLSDPQADQQARNQGGIYLDAYPVDPLTQQMPAAQHTFDPAEKQLHRPPIAIRYGQQLGIQVQPIRDQDHDVWRPILPRLARGD